MVQSRLPPFKKSPEDQNDSLSLMMMMRIVEAMCENQKCPNKEYGLERECMAIAVAAAMERKVVKIE